MLSGVPYPYEKEQKQAMNTNYLLAGIVVVALILIGGFLYLGKAVSQPPPTAVVEVTPTPTEETPPLTVTVPVTQPVTVTPQQKTTAVTVRVGYSDSGFEPATLTVPAGTTVTWTNDSSGPMQVDSDPHPSHTDLPEINATRPTQQGATYSATFTKSGTWGYHDHLHPDRKATVIVQ